MTIKLAALAAPFPAATGNSWHHGGGIGPGAAVALGLGSLAVGVALANPYWWPGYYALAPATDYYPPALSTPRAPRWCWDAYVQHWGSRQRPAL